MNLRRISWELKFALSLVAAFVALNLLLYACYRDLGHIFLWNLTSLAFLPTTSRKPLCVSKLRFTSR